MHFVKTMKKKYRCKKPPSTPKNDCEHKMTLKIYKKKIGVNFKKNILANNNFITKHVIKKI